MTHNPIQIGRIDLGPIEPRRMTLDEQRMIDAALRRSVMVFPDDRDIQIAKLEADNEHLRQVASEAAIYRTAATSLAFLAKIARDLGFENRRTESNQEMIGRALRELAERNRP
jgi:hypothetical protein